MQLYLYIILSNLSDFLKFKFKMDFKAVKQLAALTMHLAQELLMNLQCTSGSEKLCKGGESLENEGMLTGKWKVTTAS